MSGSLTTPRALARLAAWRRASGYAPATIQLEQRSLGRLLPRLARPLARVRRADVEAWLAARLGEVAPATAARELGVLRALYRLLVAEGALGHDPTRELTVREGARRRPSLVLSEAEVERLLAEASRPGLARRSVAVREALALRNRAALELLYGLGLRAGEACGLRALDLDLAQAELRVTRVKRCRPGGLPIPPAVVGHLEAYLAAGRPELLRRRDASAGRLLVNERGRPLTVNQLERTLNQIAERAGVRAHPHALRRSPRDPPRAARGAAARRAGAARAPAALDHPALRAARRDRPARRGRGARA